MSTKAEEITVNNVVYVRKDSIPAVQKSSIAKGYFIVRSSQAGVSAGEIVKRIGKEVHMKNARRLWYWKGANTLFDIAMEGVSQPESCKFSGEVDSVIITDACEILTVSTAAQKCIKDVPIWK